MKYSLLGNTGINVSALCFGSLTMGPLQNGLPPEEGGSLLLEAFEAGVNFVDTAQLYQTYPHIRWALKRFGGEVAVATKTYAYTLEAASQALEEARSGLGRDVIDIMLLHEQESGHTLRGHAEALDFLLSEKAKGRIRAVGLSTHAVAGVDAAVSAGLDVVHPLLNLSGLGILDGSREDMEAAVLRAREAGLGIYTMKALGGGHLFARAAEALVYAMRWGHSLAVGMKSRLELASNLYFWEHGHFQPDNEEILLRQSRQIFIEDHCDMCRRCILACKAKALVPQGFRVSWNKSSCVFCGYCAAHCQEFCIKMI